MARDLILTFGDFRKAAQRQKTATTGSTSSSRFLRTAFSSRRLTAISAMFEGLPLRAGRFAFSALGTDCSLVLISSARYLDCRNRGTRFLLRDFARGLSSRRGKHPEQQGKQEKHKPLRGKSVHACFILRLISTGSARPIQREAPATADRHRKKFGAFSTTHPPNKQRTRRQVRLPSGIGAAGESMQGISGKQLNGRRRPQLALPVQAGSCALHSLQGASLPSPPCLKDCP